MAINFGDTIMEGSIEPTARVQQPVQDNSGAVLAESLGGAARAVGAIAGSIFKQGQEDTNSKILTQYENDLLDIADAVDQNTMSRNEAMIKARNLRRQYLSNAPALQDDFDTVWSDFAGANGLGHVVIQGTPEEQNRIAMQNEAAKLGYPDMASYELFLARGRELAAKNQQAELLQRTGQIMTETQRNDYIRTATGMADAGYVTAQTHVNKAMADIEANPSNKAAIVEQLNFVLGSEIANLQALTGNAPDTDYITTPAKTLLDTFNKWANGETSNAVLEGQIKSSGLQYELMYASDPTLARVIAASKVIGEIGMQNTTLFSKLFTSEVIQKFGDMANPTKTVNLTDGTDGSARTSEAIRQSAGMITGDSNPELIQEINNAINQAVDSAYVHERSADGAMGFKDIVELLGSNEVGAFLSSHGKIEAEHAPQLVNILKNNYETELLPVVNRAWTEPVPIVDPSTISTGDPNAVVGGMQNIPMNQLLEPRWNGNALEFVPTAAYANNPRVIQLAQDVTSGDNSIGIPLNNLINAYSNVTGVDGKTIYEQDFAGRLFGIGVEGESDEESEFSISPEDDAQLDLSSFQPDELVTPVQMASLGNVELNDSEFIEPTSNPNVDPTVLKKFEGRRIPVSIRNNNMGAVSITGNIQDSWAAKQPGFVGVTPRPANEGGYYAKYATPEHGVAAASKLLELYGKRGVDSPAAIVRKWSVDRSAHNSYQNTLVRYLKEAGYNADANTALDLNDPSIRMAILKAKSAHESGAGRPVYNDRVFRAGVGMGV